MGYDYDDRGSWVVARRGLPSIQVPYCACFIWRTTEEGQNEGHDEEKDKVDSR